MPNRLWTEDEVLLAFNLYLKTPSGSIERTNPALLHLAGLLGKTPASVVLKLTNFESTDPWLQHPGIPPTPRIRRQFGPWWEEYTRNGEDLLFESEQLLAAKEKVPLEEKYNALFNGLAHHNEEGRNAEAKARVSREVFRQMIVSANEYRCMLTGIPIPELLEAPLIVPPAHNSQERLNPENALCLSALYARAFEKGLIAITPEGVVLLSKALKKKEHEAWYRPHFGFLDYYKLPFTGKYHPRRGFLQHHLDTIFDRQP